MDNDKTTEKLKKTTNDLKPGYLDYQKIKHHLQSIIAIIPNIEEQARNSSAFHLNTKLLKSIETYTEAALQEALTENGKKLFQYNNAKKILTIVHCLSETLTAIQQISDENISVNISGNKFFQNIYKHAVEALYAVLESDYILQTTRNTAAKTLIQHGVQYISKEHKKQHNQAEENQCIVSKNNICKQVTILQAFMFDKKIAYTAEYKNTKSDNELSPIIYEKIMELNNLIDLCSQIITLCDQTNSKYKSKAELTTLKTKINAENLMPIIELLKQIHSLTQQYVKATQEYQASRKANYSITLYQIAYQTICHQVQDMLEVISIADNISSDTRTKAYMLHLFTVIQEKCTLTKAATSELTQSKIHLEQIPETIDPQTDKKELELAKDKIIEIFNANIQYLEKCDKEQNKTPTITTGYFRKTINIMKSEIQSIEQAYSNYYDYIKMEQPQKSVSTQETSSTQQLKDMEAMEAPETVLSNSLATKTFSAITTGIEI